MNNKGVITQLILEIIAIGLTVFITIPIWKSIDSTSKNEIASYYDNYYYISYNIINEKNYVKVTLNNESNTVENYNLVMKIKKDNHIDIHQNKINLLNQEKNLDDFEIIDKENYYYVILDHSSLVSGTYTYEMKLNDDVFNNCELVVLENI